jgi:hypothetical protein
MVIEISKLKSWSVQIGRISYFLFLPFFSLTAQNIKDSVLIDSLEKDIDDWVINIRQNTYALDLDQVIIIQIHGGSVIWFDFLIDTYLNEIKMLNKGYLRNQSNKLLINDILQDYKVLLNDVLSRSNPSRIMIRVKYDVGRISQGYITSLDEKFISRIQKIISYDLTTGNEFIESEYNKENKRSWRKSRKILRKRS